MGRKAINIDKEQFEDLLELQCTKEDISGFFHCSNDTIERWCRKTYGDTFSHVSDDYRSIGRVSLRRSQFAMAKTNPQMAIHLGKQYLGQADKTETKVTGGLDVKHGNITRVIYYDPETQKPTEEEINGEAEDVDAFIEDPEHYNGDSITFKLPNKDPDPAELEGEKIIVGHQGNTLVRAYLPWDGREDPPVTFKNCETGDPIKIPDPDRIQIRSGSTGAEIEFPDDGRGGYGDPPAGADIEITTPDVKYRWKSNGRGGYLPR